MSSILFRAPAEMDVFGIVDGIRQWIAREYKAAVSSGVANSAAHIIDQHLIGRKFLIDSDESVLDGAIDMELVKFSRPLCTVTMSRSESGEVIGRVTADCFRLPPVSFPEIHPSLRDYDGLLGGKRFAMDLALRTSPVLSNSLSAQELGEFVQDMPIPSMDSRAKTWAAAVVWTTFLQEFRGEVSSEQEFEEAARGAVADDLVEYGLSVLPPINSALLLLPLHNFHFRPEVAEKATTLAREWLVRSGL